jgi:hypothetical protein
MPNISTSRGKITVKPYKKELEILDSALGLCRYMARAADGDQSTECKAAADALEKVRSRFTPVVME